MLCNNRVYNTVGNHRYLGLTVGKTDFPLNLCFDASLYYTDIVRDFGIFKAFSVLCPKVPPNLNFSPTKKTYNMNAEILFFKYQLTDTRASFLANGYHVCHLERKGENRQ